MTRMMIADVSSIRDTRLVARFASSAVAAPFSTPATFADVTDELWETADSDKLLEDANVYQGKTARTVTLPQRRQDMLLRDLNFLLLLGLSVSTLPSIARAENCEAANKTRDAYGKARDAAFNRKMAAIKRGDYVYGWERDRKAQSPTVCRAHRDKIKATRAAVQDMAAHSDCFRAKTYEMYQGFLAEAQKDAGEDGC